MKLCGWFGALFFALCTLPELYYAFTTGECLLSWPFLILWGLGELFTLIPVIFHIKSRFLIFNYTFSLICVILLIGVKL